MEKFEHVGSQPIEHKGKWYVKGDEISAEPDDMKFFLQIGAVQKKSDPVRSAFTTKLKE